MAGDAAANENSMSHPILIVDDDPTTRFLMARTLAAVGMETMEACSGAQALSLIHQVSFGAVLLDNQMPEMGGLDVLASLRENPETRTLPVILVTGDGEIADRVRGLQAGADDYVVKPFKPAELVARVEAQLREQAAWAEVIEGHLHRRATVASALGQVSPGATPEATAEVICRELGATGHDSGAALLAFIDDGVVVPLAVSDLPVWNMETGIPLPRSLGNYLAVKAEHGPWIEKYDQDPSAAISSRPALELDTLACAPLYRGGRPGGLLVLGANLSPAKHRPCRPPCCCPRSLTMPPSPGAALAGPLTTAVSTPGGVLPSSGSSTLERSFPSSSPSWTWLTSPCWATRPLLASPTGPTPPYASPKRQPSEWG